MTKAGYSPRPGEQRTVVILWNADDTTKAGDPRYWWTEEETAKWRNHLPESSPDLAGRPKGQLLASFLVSEGSDEVELVRPASEGTEERTMRFSIPRGAGANPERTYLIVQHQRRPNDAEQQELKQKGFPWPETVETLRQEWLAALADKDDQRAGELRRELDAAFKEHGFRKPTDTSPWNPDRAVQVQPGVWLQDERPT
jgi:hypothetical protein